MGAPVLTERPPACPLALYHLMLKCWKPRRSERPPIQVLRKHLTGVEESSCTKQPKQEIECDLVDYSVIESANVYNNPETWNVKFPNKSSGDDYGGYADISGYRLSGILFNSDFSGTRNTDKSLESVDHERTVFSISQKSLAPSRQIQYPLPPPPPQPATQECESPIGWPETYSRSNTRSTTSQSSLQHEAQRATRSENGPPDIKVMKALNLQPSVSSSLLRPDQPLSSIQQLPLSSSAANSSLPEHTILSPLSLPLGDNSSPPPRPPRLSGLVVSSTPSNSLSTIPSSSVPFSPPPLPPRSFLRKTSSPVHPQESNFLRPPSSEIGEQTCSTDPPAASPSSQAEYSSGSSEVQCTSSRRQGPFSLTFHEVPSTAVCPEMQFSFSSPELPRSSSSCQVPISLSSSEVHHSSSYPEVPPLPCSHNEPAPSRFPDALPSHSTSEVSTSFDTNTSKVPSSTLYTAKEKADELKHRTFAAFQATNDPDKNTQVSKTTCEPIPTSTQASKATHEPVSTNTQPSESIHDPIHKTQPVIETMDNPVCTNAQDSEAIYEDIDTNTQASESIDDQVYKNTPVSKPISTSTQASETTDKPASTTTQPSEPGHDPVHKTTPVIETMDSLVCTKAQVSEAIYEDIDTNTSQ